MGEKAFPKLCPALYLLDIFDDSGIPSHCEPRDRPMGADRMLVRGTVANSC